MPRRHLVPIVAISSCLALAAGGFLSWSGVSGVTHAEVTVVGVTPIVVLEPVAMDAVVGPLAPPIFETARPVRDGETITEILASLGLPAQSIVSASKKLFDLGRIRSGRTLQLFRRLDEDKPSVIVYPLDEDGDQRLVIQNLGSDGWYAFKDEVAYEHRPTVRTFTVTSSLWEQATEVGLRPSDILAIAKVFEYEIDFNTEIHDGMTTEIVTDELWRDGKLVKLGTIQAVRLKNPSGGGKTKDYVAIRYQPKKDGSPVGYYSPDGLARKKAFLRSPLEFSRVTSGFTKKRFHPVLKTTRAHNGTDFGAPTGTPVRAVADGVVSFSGTSGGHGKHVKLDHPGPYDTSYSHLSKILVTKGSTVRQGQIVGLVGSTGLATGPHLHYQFWLHGNLVDPLKVDLPLTEELEKSELAPFFAVRDRMLDRLNGIAVAADTPEVPTPTGPTLEGPTPADPTEEARGASSLPSSPG